MVTTLSKSQIISLKPVRQDKDDKGQLKFLQRFFMSLPRDEFVFIGKKMDNSRMRQESFSGETGRKSVANGNFVLTGDDIYIAPNTMVSTKCRQKDNIGHLTAFFTDIDYSKIKEYKTKSPSQVADEVLNHCKKFHLPLPTMIISTGHGLHVWWMLNRPMQARFIHVWDAIQTCIYNEFKSFGADACAKDAARFLRVPGTMNVKDKNAPAEVAVIYMNAYRKAVDFDSMYRWAKKQHKANWLRRIRHICSNVSKDIPLYQLESLIAEDKIHIPAKEKFVPFILNEPAQNHAEPPLEKIIQKRVRRSESAEECSRRHQVKALSVNPMRVKDLETLVAIRQGEMTGKRELFLHHYRNTLARCGFNIREQAQKLTETNAIFTEPLPENEIKNILNQRKLYMARNETIIQDLDITATEQMMLLTIIGKDEKERRRVQKNKCGTSNDERVKGICAKILKQIALGKSTSEIADIIGCTTRTVRNYIHKYDLLGKGAVFCAAQMAEEGKSTPEHRDQNEIEDKAAEKAASTYANNSVNEMKRQVGDTAHPKPKRLTKREKNKLVSQILTLLQTQIPNFREKLKAVADTFYKEYEAALLIVDEQGKISYTKLFYELILRIAPGFFGRDLTSALAQNFAQALYAV